MEGVCVLANVRKMTVSAATCTSRAILLGGQKSQAPRQSLREIVLGIIQNKAIGSRDLDVGSEFHEDSDAENYFLDQDEEIRDYSLEYKEEITLLFNLALDALSHALEVLVQFGMQDPCSDPTQPDSSPLSTSAIVESFLNQANTVSRTGTELLSTLLLTLQRAYLNPHNAWLAAKCLRFICAVCPSASERLMVSGVKQSLKSAMVVGVASHAKLEWECVQLGQMLA
jgi:hypothetical protein